MPENIEAYTIWESFRAGNEDAFARLFYLYSDALFYYGCTITNDRELIKDSIQELFCNLWERKEQCPAVSKVKYFLLTALRRIILRKIQQQQRFIYKSPGQQQQERTEFSKETASPEENTIRLEIITQSQDQLKKAIQSLPPRQKEAIHLRYYQGLTYTEMAEVMAVQQGSIGQFIAQAIRALRKKVDRTHTFFLLFFNLLF